MAVAPARQRAGIGTRLIRRGLDDCRAAGLETILVLSGVTRREAITKYSYQPNHVIASLEEVQV